jgi:hypothetical protein
MDRWTFTFCASLAIAISMTALTTTSQNIPTVVAEVPANTSWPSLSKPTPVTP